MRCGSRCAVRWNSLAGRATGAASKVQAGWVCRVVGHSKEGMAEFAAVDAVVPRLRLGWQLLAPGGACLVDGVIMIEVQMCEHSWSLWAAQIDTECVWATSAVQRTHTLKRLLRKRRHISVFVARVRMLDKRVPDAVPEKGAHVPRQTRSWCAHQSTPALLGPSCHERLRAAL